MEPRENVERNNIEANNNYFNNPNFNNDSTILDNAQLNNINLAVSQALSNPFIINNLANSVISNINNKMVFKAPISKSVNNIYGPNESYQTNLRSKEILNKKRNQINSDDEELLDSINKEEKKDKKSKINK